MFLRGRNGYRMDHNQDLYARMGFILNQKSFLHLTNFLLDQGPGYGRLCCG